jgi:hypothetical protein
MGRLRDLDFPPTLTRIGVGKPIGTASFPRDLIEPKASDNKSGCRGIVTEYLRSKTWARAFLYFLDRERLRHLQDVEKIERDMADLCNEWGLRPPDVKDLKWISTKKP